MTKTKRRLLLLALAVSALAHGQPAWHLVVSSTVEKDERGLGGASIELLQGSALVKKTVSAGNGYFSVDVPPNGEYTLRVSYQDCNSKYFSISTKGVPEDVVQRDRNRPSMSIDGVTMKKPLYSIDYSALKMPMAKILYDPESKKFGHDEDHTNRMLDALEAIREAERILLEKRLNAIKDGDAALKKNDCPLAKKNYQKAINLIPELPYDEEPKLKLSQADVCIAEKEAAKAGKAEKEKAAAELAAKQKEEARAKQEAEKLAKQAAEQAAKEQAAREKEAALLAEKQKAEAEALAKRQAEAAQAEKAAKDKEAAALAAKAKAEAEAKEKAQAAQAEKKKAAELAAKAEADAKLQAEAALAEKEKAALAAKAEAEAKQKAEMAQAEKEKAAAQQSQETAAREEARLKEEAAALAEKSRAEKEAREKAAAAKAKAEAEKAALAKREAEKKALVEKQKQEKAAAELAAKQKAIAEKTATQTETQKPAETPQSSESASVTGSASEVKPATAEPVRKSIPANNKRSAIIVKKTGNSSEGGGRPVKEGKVREASGERAKGDSEHSIPQVLGSDAKYRESITAADDYYKMKRWAEAKAAYEQALKYRQDDPHAKKRLEEIAVQTK